MVHAIAVRDRLAELGETTTVALITFTDPESLKRYQQVHQLPFPNLADHERIVYRAYGLGRGTVRRVWGMRTLRSYMQIIMRRGTRGLRLPKEDSLQLGGDFVIAPNGTLAWGYWCEGPDDRPSVDELIEVVSAIDG